MAEDFSKAVEDGLRLSKRIYFGKDRSVAPPKPMMPMEKSNFEASLLLPTSPMVYAVIGDPSVVDNPDIPSYQPHVHGRCDPPALIPLQMNGIAMEVDCYLDTAFVTVSGSWRIHCVMGSAHCDCRIAIPMGEQGSILGAEVDVIRKSYCTRLVVMDENESSENLGKAEDGGFLKPNIFTLTIPQVDGGSNLSIKVKWSQKLLYQDGQFTLKVPFSFPEYVTPAGKKISKKEKLQLNVNSGPTTEVLCKTTSHPLKELRREVGKLGFICESDVLSWSSSDFVFTYTVSSSHTSGGVLLQSPPNFNQKETFCLYLFPGSQQRRKVFRKELIIVVDISESMRGKLIEDTKNAVIAALSKLDQEDSFTIIAFNDKTYLFSSSLELATKEAVENATQWINMNFIAGGGTNMSLPLNQALEMLSGTQKSIPILFFITDGAVEDERQICKVMKSQLRNQGSFSPRIYTFGIGAFCNHYFLRMLAMIGRGHYDAAHDTDSIEARMEVLFSKASSTIMVNIEIDGLEDCDDLEVHPSCIPDLSSEEPLIISGCYKGGLPNFLKARGILADMSEFTLDLTVHHAKDIPLDKVLAKQQIELYTAQAWFSEDKELRGKIAKISIQSGVVSEYTRMILFETDKGKQAAELGIKAGKKETDPKKTVGTPSLRTIVLQHFGVGFGDLIATAENTPPGTNEPKLPEAAEMFVRAASNCCGRICDKCCCMCCIQTCSRMNDQCAVVLIQLCTALSVLGCFACCELCGGD